MEEIVKMIVSEIFVATCAALTVTILILFGFSMVMVLDIKRRTKAKENGYAN
jgi:hypothetical protein